MMSLEDITYHFEANMGAAFSKADHNVTLAAGAVIRKALGQ